MKGIAGACLAVFLIWLTVRICDTLWIAAVVRPVISYAVDGRIMPPDRVGISMSSKWSDPDGAVRAEAFVAGLPVPPPKAGLDVIGETDNFERFMINEAGADSLIRNQQTGKYVHLATRLAWSAWRKRAEGTTR